MHSALEDVVTLGGLALQAEDCLIRSARHHRGEHGGLASLENERHHQFIIWRAILPVWHAVLEKEFNTDIILSRDNSKHYFELKNWRGSTGNQQMPSIQSDVRKLRQWDNGYILITSINPVGSTDSNIEHLIRGVAGLNASERKDFRFRTIGCDGVERDYWLAGWPVIKTDQAGTLAT